MKRYIRSNTLYDARNAFDISGQTPDQVMNTWYNFLVKCGLNTYLNDNDLREGQDYNLDLITMKLSADENTMICRFYVDIKSNVRSVDSREVFVATPEIYFAISVMFEFTYDSYAPNTQSSRHGKAVAVALGKGEYDSAFIMLSRLDPRSLNSKEADIGYVESDEPQTDIAKACNINKFSEALSIIVDNFADWYIEASTESTQYYESLSNIRKKRSNSKHSNEFTAHVAVADQYPYDIDENMTEQDMINNMEDNGKPYFESVNDAFEALYESTGSDDVGIQDALRELDVGYGNDTTPPVITYMLGDNYEDQQAGYIEWLSKYKGISPDFE